MTADKGKLTATLVLLLAAALPGCDQSLSERAESDKVAYVPDDDPDMKRAFEKARASLDEFFEIAAAPRAGTEGHAIKVAVSEGDDTEYFWVTEFEGEGDTLSGVLNNGPESVKKYKMGERFEFSRAQVVDWMYFEPAARRMHGNFTACALLVHEPADEAEDFKKQYGLQCD
jgi:uncharacterized protein YegJ (DUF2314 family)